MATEDREDAEVDLKHGRYPSAVFHSQQCCEKTCKALLMCLGIEPGKTHFPSYELKSRVLRGRYRLTRNQLRTIERVIDLSSVLESQKEFPRYGWETKERVILPSEIYDEEKATWLFESAEEVLKLAKNFVKSLKK